VEQQKITRKLVVCLILIGLAVVGSSVTQRGKVDLPGTGEPTRPGYYRVVHVTDGDTFNVRIAGKVETVRLVGMDTPETHDPRKPVQCYGPQAADEAHHLLDGKQVRLVGDPTDSDRDKYHRLLRYAYLENGTLYNQYMVENGYAFAYIIFPNIKLEQFKEWEAEAKQKRLGIWGACQVHLDGKIEQTQPAP